MHDDVLSNHLNANETFLGDFQTIYQFFFIFLILKQQHSVRKSAKKFHFITKTGVFPTKKIRDCRFQGSILFWGMCASQASFPDMYLTWIGFLCEYGIKFPFCCFWKCFHLEPPSFLSIWVLVSSLPFLIYFSFPLHLKLIIRLLLCHSSVPSHLLPASIEKTPWCFVRKTLKTWRRGAFF